jgi:6-phosphogluconolactonase
MITRRRLLALLPATALHTRLHAQAGIFTRKPKVQPPLPHPLVLFGTNTSRPAAKGIYSARFDPNVGRFGPPVLTAACVRPSFLALNGIYIPIPPKPKSKAEIPLPRAPQPQNELRHMLYAVNEGDDKTSGISSYQLDPATGVLKFVGQVSSGGTGPCYIAVDTSGRSAYVANYAGGTIATYQVLPDGSLSQPVDRVDFHNREVFGHTGPVKPQQDGPHPHSATLSPDNRFVVVNDLGDDTIATFPIDAKTAYLGKPHLFQTMAPGSGPRHIAFHPNQRWAYGIDELASRIDQYLYTDMHAGPGVEAQAIFSAAGHSVSTLDPGFRGTSWAAEVYVVPTGDYLYASNRGEDTLVVFAVNQTTGALTLRQRISCGGKTPRHFTLDHSGSWMICGNQDSASVTVFARAPGTGKLTGPVQTMALESPMFTLFV